ncbi:hypothetical protein BHE74_00017206 [Ensete ventricosum]|nr:hypothetical protein BHE74_00017206 [Ensete ventricosum]
MSAGVGNPSDSKVETIARLAQWRIESFGPCSYRRSDAFRLGIWNWYLSVEKNRYMHIRLFPEPCRVSKEHLPTVRYRVVRSIGVVSTPISAVTARAVSIEGEGRRGRRKGRIWRSGAALPRHPDPSLLIELMSPRHRQRLLLSHAGRRSLGNVIEASQAHGE